MLSFVRLVSVIVLCNFLLSPVVNATDEARAFYAPMWMITSPSAVEYIIAKARQYHFNQVYLQVRGRADAYYYPNRDDGAYINFEPRAQLYSLNPADFDPLQHAIDLAHNGSPRIEVHAWVVIYPVWNRTTLPTSSNHLYRIHPEWVTEDASGVTMSPTTDSEGAYLDPGILAVQDYIFNVLMDILRNYDIDGLHFDYIRHHTGDWGYDPLAKMAFQQQTGWNIDTDMGITAVWHNWKRAQISALVQRVYCYMKAEKPWISLSAFLPSFTDTVVNNYQAYNFWSRYGWIDVLQRGSYSNTVSSALSRYQSAQAYNYGNLPVQCPLGSEDAYNNTPETMVDIITALRNEVPSPIGFNHFQYAGLSANSDERFKYIGDTAINPDAPYATHVAIPLAKPDTIPPNPPASPSASSPAPGEILIHFSRPSAASDGDFPVQYRIYRDTDDTVEEYYANLKMVFYDDTSLRTIFSWTDTDIPATGSYYYKIVSYDDFFNQSSTLVSTPVTSVNIIIDNTDAGFSIQSGSWYTGTSAPDKYGSNYSVNDVDTGADRARWTPTISTAGVYKVYVWYPQGSNRAPDAHYTVTYAGGSQTFIINQQTNGGQWNLLGSFLFSTSTSGYIELSDESSQSSRVVIADAVRFQYGAASAVPWEIKPVALPVPTPPMVPAIIDNSPVYLNYEDSSGWASSTFGTVYGADKRYSSSPTGTKASYVFFISYPGIYAIDGWITGNNSYAEQARYRFRHTSGIQESVVSQHHSGTASDADFWINVDGVEDLQAFSFDKGFLFITLHNTSSDSLTIADALRLRFLSPAQERNAWFFY